MNTPDTRPAALWALATAAVTIAPHMLYLPLWVSACCVVLLGWHAVRCRQGAPASGRMLRLFILLLVAAIAGGIRLHFGYFLGKDPGIALLAVLLCMKLLEGSSTRDLRAAILLALFLQLGLFFNDQSLPVAALALGGALLAITTLIAIEDPAVRPLPAFRSSGVLMLQALPFLIVLFLLFPRLPGPLWGLPADAHSGVTGLSDEMQPGSIAQLTESGEIALRVEFAGEPPPPSQRYWRGPVLTDFDGRTWRARNAPLRDAPLYTPSGPRYDYVSIVEPHQRRWLLAMDFPGPVDRPRTRYAGDLQLLSDSPLGQRTRVALSAWPETPVGLNESPFVLRLATRLPEDSSPRTRALVEQLADGAGSPREVLDRVLAHLQLAGLTYTLSPPLLGNQPVDEFLFDTQRGFCEHFSSAFAVMMRIAGIPARVVTGYQGGTINRFDGSLVVRQSEAHAWVEVWLAGSGWLRVDPTALAAPDRIEYGLSDSLPDGETRPLIMRSGFAIETLRGMRDRWEALSNTWNRNIVGFDQQRQRNLLSRLGLDGTDLRTLLLTLVGTVSTLLAALLVWALRRRPRGDSLDRMWHRFCARMARRGLARLPSEGPIDFAERIAHESPANAADVRSIAHTYARLRYGAVSTQTAARIRELSHRIREFSPQ